MRITGSRLARRHLLAIVALTIAFSLGSLLVQIQLQYSAGIDERNEALEVIRESHLPPVARALFFFDTEQLTLLADGMTLLPYVQSVAIYEQQADEQVQILHTGEPDEDDPNAEVFEYPLRYEHEEEMREIGSVLVTTSLTELRSRILQQTLFIAGLAFVTILGFALVVLVFTHRMVFRHLTRVATFMEELDPERLSEHRLNLARRTTRNRAPDELDEITEAINTTLIRLDTAIEERTTLLNELYHRTGNMLQSIQSLLRLHASREPENEQLQDVVHSVGTRIMAMALVQQRLYATRSLARIDAHDYLTELVHQIYGSFNSGYRNVDLQMDIERTSLLFDIATPCGMVVTELVSNSLQHAFPDGQSGTVFVSFRALDNKQFELLVSDNGVGVSSDFDYHTDGSIGLQSVIGIVETQLQGSIECTMNEGLHWRIRFSDSNYRDRVQNGRKKKTVSARRG